MFPVREGSTREHRSRRLMASPTATSRFRGPVHADKIRMKARSGIGAENASRKFCRFRFPRQAGRSRLRFRWTPGSAFRERRSPDVSDRCRQRMNDETTRRILTRPSFRATCRLSVRGCAPMLPAAFHPERRWFSAEDGRSTSTFLPCRTPGLACLSARRPRSREASGAFETGYEISGSRGRSRSRRAEPRHRCRCRTRPECNSRRRRTGWRRPPPAPPRSAGPGCCGTC